MPTTSDWTIPGAADQKIHGSTYQPESPAIGCVIVAHGFKGYKDFRMIPAIAAGLSHGGFVSHAFNFSHSGMTASADTFERPDLFELDTWNKQVMDLGCIVQAVADGHLPGTGLPYLLLGHSRGGVSAILFGGRQSTERASLPCPVGIITVGSPDYTCGLTKDQTAQLRQVGYLESPSARTGQILRIGLPWLAEQESDPAAHDVLHHAGRLACPVLVVHGENDETVDVGCAKSLAGAATNGQIAHIKNCNHVLGAPNPPPADTSTIPELSEAIERIVQFSRDCCEDRSRAPSRD